MHPRLGGVEAGGTKFVCLVGSGPDDVVAETTIPTTSPAETLTRVVDFFRPHRRLTGIGVGAFGPVDLASGSITNTPKPGWANTDLRAALGVLGVPVTVDTDVNAAALAESRWGTGVGDDPLVYVTVGTGIGGGVIAGGRPVHGLVHPEIGHMRVPRDPDDAFAGACPFHGDCLEGLASGPAIRARRGLPGEALAVDDPVWTLEARYLALGLANVMITTLPGAGTLTLSGNPVTLGQLVSAGDIAAGNLRFMPAANANGAGYASFTFQVQDDGGTANGGVNLDPTPNTMTVDVTAVNDAPSGTDTTVTTLEDTAYVFAAADFGFSDASDSPANGFDSVTITTAPVTGALELSGVAVTDVQADGAKCPVCEFEQVLDQICEEHGVYKITPRR